jgi:hypothetical protein
LSDGAQGGPILYICPTDAVPFQNYEEYRQATHDFPKPANDMNLVWMVKGQGLDEIGNKIHTDGTEEGFYEYALFQLLSNQFYLLGKAQYNDKSVVADSSALDTILDEIKNTKDWTPVDIEFLKEARKIDLQPTVQISDPNVLIHMVLFTKWGGFARFSILMKRDYPHTILSSSFDSVLEYDCGVQLQNANAAGS